MVLELPAGGVECVPYGHIDVFVGVMLARVAVDDERTSGHANLDAHVIDLALAVVPVRRLDHHAAGVDSPEEGLELVDPFADLRLDRIGGIHIAK